MRLRETDKLQAFGIQGSRLTGLATDHQAHLGTAPWQQTTRRILALLLGNRPPGAPRHCPPNQVLGSWLQPSTCARTFMPSHRHACNFTCARARLPCSRPSHRHACSSTRTRAHLPCGRPSKEGSSSAMDMVRLLALLLVPLIRARLLKPPPAPAAPRCIGMPTCAHRECGMGTRAHVWIPKACAHLALCVRVCVCVCCFSSTHLLVERAFA